MIKLKDIQYLYDPRTPAGVSRLNLEIIPGSFNALIGPSGSGKSTLLKIITRKVEVQSGEVIIPNLSKIVFSNQSEIESEEMSVQDYLVSKFLLEEKEDYEAINKARDLLHEFEITHIIQQKIKNVSRGEGQRLWLAGLLMNDPEVILLDEAFNGLDWQNRHNMITTLLKISREKKITVIWATQLLEEALRYSQNLILLEYGRIQQQGPVEELINSPKNRFVAQFVARKNFILLSPSKQQSDFGTIQEVAVEKEAILILDPFTCEEGEHEGKVLESYYDYGRYINVIEYKERTYLGHSKKQLTPNQRTKFKISTLGSTLLSEV